jgi:hypothetical protein
MDRIFSARIDDAIYQKIKDLSTKLHTSKKSVIEKAIGLLGQRFEQEKETNVFDETCGIWKRSEVPEEIVSQVRTVFRESMRRYHQ